MLQGLNEPPGAAQADVPGLQLALAVIVSLYVLRDKKRLDLGKHLLFTTLGLISVCQASLLKTQVSKNHERSKWGHAVIACIHGPLSTFLQSSFCLCSIRHLLSKNIPFGAVRAGGITAAGLIAGAVIGSALQSWLRVDIVPIGVSTYSFVNSMQHTEAIVVMEAIADKFAHHVRAVLMIYYLCTVNAVLHSLTLISGADW